MSVIGGFSFSLPPVAISKRASACPVGIYAFKKNEVIEIVSSSRGPAITY